MYDICRCRNAWPGAASEDQGQALVKAKELAHTAGVYVKDNPSCTKPPLPVRSCRPV